MQNLKINPAYAGKTITKDLGYTTQRIEVDKLKPSQYARVFSMGFEEIFLTEKADGTETVGEIKPTDNGKEKEREHTSNTETENSGGTTPVVERVQSVAKKPRKKRTNS